MILKNQDGSLSGFYLLFDFLNIIFISYFLQLQFPQVKKWIIPIAIFMNIVLLFCNNWSFLQYSDKLGIASGMYAIVISLLYFVLIVKDKNPNATKLTDKPAFWFFTSQLLGSVFFLLRLLPRYYFNEIDADFLNNIRHLFLAITVLSYVLIFIALSKYKKAYA